MAEDTLHEDRLLSDFYREFGVSWEKTLRRLNLPVNIGIDRTMTLKVAREFAAKRASRPASNSFSTVPLAIGNIPQAPEPFTGDPLSSDILETVRDAIRQEVSASKGSSTSFSLEIDGIRHLQNSGGRFVYQLLLSHPVNFSPEQVLTFQTRKTKETITATVVKCDDDGMMVETQQPLPTDAKLIHVTFDPSFIYKAIGDYLEGAFSTRISDLFLGGEIPPIPEVRSWAYGEFNEDQTAAIAEMNATPIHLLWGPPGTGKTTTLGEAVANWLRKRKRVLVVCTSNAAVDVAMKALLKQIKPNERKHILRLGTSLDPIVNEFTMAAKLRGMDWKSGVDSQAALDRLNELSEQLSHHTISNERFQELFAEYTQLEGIVSRFNERANDLLPQVLSEVLVTGCTLAKMVLDKNLHQRKFDIVVIDEVSMTSVVYALAASTLAESHLVLAGDPKQLPPICQSEAFEAQEWFGQNVYDWFGVANEDDGEFDTSRFSVLRTQYRMTDEIGGLVSRLSYGNILRHGRQKRGSPVEFVDVPVEWETTHYSVSEKSYYHLGTVPIIHKLARFLAEHKELLLLSPFRPQRSLLSALAFDLTAASPQNKVVASTIHRAQGSESRAVVLDLTTHNPNKLVAFFRDRHCANLFNVGISRAQDRLFIIGSRRMLKNVAAEGRFWPEMLRELESAVSVLPSEEVLGDPIQMDDLVEAVMHASTEDLPALYSHSSLHGDLDEFVELIRNVKASRKLLVLPGPQGPQVSGDLIVRHDVDCPTVFAANGHVCVPFGDGWIPVRSPNVSRVLWRVGFSHLAEEEINPSLAKRFFCPECFNGDLLLKRFGGEGWFLVCSNSQSFECSHRKRLSLEDAKLKVRMTGMTCPENHPLTARMSGRGIFLGCENYPTCEHTASLSLLEGL